jgi:ABC-type phosphate/phosphonate transport system substrate-binding protein
MTTGITSRQAAPQRKRLTSIIRRHANLLVLLLALGLILTTPPPSAGAGETYHSVVGFSHNTFMNTDKESSQAIARLWTGQVARKRGGTTDTRILSSFTEIEREVRSKRVDLLILLPSEYLELKDRTPLEPLFVSAKKDEIFDRLVLIVRRDSGIRTMAHIKGKILLEQKGLASEGRNLWLDTLLMRDGVRDPERFFAPGSRQVLKPSMAVMPVFFRKADVCLVTRSSLKLMAELNPQLNRDLMVLAESPRAPGSVIAVRRGLPPLHREALREILGALDHDLQGQQLLTLFRMSRLVPFNPDYLEPLDKLHREHRGLNKRFSRRSL